MTHRQLFCCNTCEKTTALRTLIGHREIEPINFACDECQSRIKAELHLDQQNGKIIGYKNISGAELEYGDDFNFVINFSPDFAQPLGSESNPRAFSFIEAVQRGGDIDEFLERSRRQQLFVEIAERHHSTIERLVRNYQSANWKYFDKDAIEYAPSSDIFQSPVGRYIALGLAMEHYIAPLYGRQKHYDTNLEILEWVNLIAATHLTAFKAFLQEIASTGLLAGLQKDGFDLYLRFFQVAQDVRQVLPEWDSDNPESVDIPQLRVRGFVRFDITKTLYVDMHEHLSRVLTIVTALENISSRNDHNSYKPHPRLKKVRPPSMQAFHRLPNAPKPEMVESDFGSTLARSLEAALRNGLGHYAARLDEKAGVLHYPANLGATRMLSVDYGSFLLRLIRLMLRVQEANQLIKGLCSAALGAKISIKA